MNRFCSKAPLLILYLSISVVVFSANLFAEDQQTAAMKAYLANDYDKTIELNEQILMKESGKDSNKESIAAIDSTAIVLQMTADAYEKLGHAEKAIEYYRKTIQTLGPRVNVFRRNVRYKAGRLLFQMGKPKAAELELERCLSHVRSKAYRTDVIGMIAICLEETGNLDDAIDKYAKIFSENRKDRFAQRAIERLKAVLPEDRKTISEAWALYNQGKYTEAQKEINRIAKSNVYKEHLQALVLAKTGKTPEAIEHFLKVIYEVPGFVSPYHQLRNTLFLMKFNRDLDNKHQQQEGEAYKLAKDENWEGSISRMRSGLNKYPWHPSSYRLIARCASLSGNYALGERNYAIYLGMTNAIFFASGDARNIESAVKVLNVEEEYIFLEKAGYKKIRQVLLRRDGIHYDALEAIHEKTGRKKTFYFDVSYMLGEQQNSRMTSELIVD